MNLPEQDTRPTSDYRTKRPDKFNNCPACGNLKRTHANLCRPCKESFRPSIFQPDDPTVKHIALTQGQVALVDAGLYDWLNGLCRWQAQWNPKTRSFYAVGFVNSRATRMNRLILGLEHGDPRTGDHVESGRTLDNRLSNLRMATGNQNAKNRRKNRDNTSGYKGVSPRGGRWIAQILVDSKVLYLGTFDDPRDAHEAYRKAALKYRGEFANFG